MVVMVLIGLLSSALALTVSDGPPPVRQSREQLQQFSLRIYEQAVIRNQLLGLQITGEGQVRALGWQSESSSWQPETGTQLASWTLPDKVQWQLENSTSGTRRDGSSSLLPQIRFNPQGLVSPFSLRLEQSGQSSEIFDDHFFYPQVSDAKP